MKNGAGKKRVDNEMIVRKQSLLQNRVSKFGKLLLVRSRVSERGEQDSKAKKRESFISEFKL